MSSECVIFRYTGNCPTRSTCKCTHGEKKKLNLNPKNKDFTPILKETEDISDNTASVTTIADKVRKPLKKLGKEVKEFVAGVATDVKDFLASNNKDNAQVPIPIDDEENQDMEDEVEDMFQDISFFDKQFENCKCCRGHVYNCNGIICQNLGCCFCYAVDTNEEVIRQAKQGH